MNTSKPKVLCIASVDTAKCLQLKHLYNSLLGTNDTIVVEASNKKMLIKCIKTCPMFQKYQVASPFPATLFCFDGQSNLLCSFTELCEDHYQIKLSREVVKGYAGRVLSFDDKKKILYQMHIGEMLDGVVPDIPWWALTLPQMISFAQERVERINENKVKALPYPQSWLACKIKSGEEFRRQFGQANNFNYALFGFSLNNPLDCSWSCIKSPENKKFVNQVKTAFSKGQTPSNKSPRVASNHRLELQSPQQFNSGERKYSPGGKNDPKYEEQTLNPNTKPHFPTC